MEFDFSLITGSLPLLLQGALVTLEITALSVGLGLVFGLIAALAQISKFAPLRLLGKIYVDFIRGTPLLVQIFEPNLPLHDGAVVIRGNRITAATCYLPLSENKTISKELGTRHRAGLGISEVTDALTVIVSEETGQVSLTKDGQLYRNVNSDRLRELLGGTQRSEKTQTVWDRLRKGRKRHEK